MQSFDHVRAGLAFLRSGPEIDAGRIGLIGHSEGGLIGAMVAGRDPEIAFLVLMAGNGIPAREMLLSQTRREAASGRVGQALREAVFAAVTAPGSQGERKAAVSWRWSARKIGCSRLKKIFRR